LVPSTVPEFCIAPYVVCRTKNVVHTKNERFLRLCRLKMLVTRKNGAMHQTDLSHEVTYAAQPAPSTASAPTRTASTARATASLKSLASPQHRPLRFSPSQNMWPIQTMLVFSGFVRAHKVLYHRSLCTDSVGDRARKDFYHRSLCTGSVGDRAHKILHHRSLSSPVQAASLLTLLLSGQKLLSSLLCLAFLAANTAQ